MTKKITNAIILAGGKGTRLSEQTKTIPKPLVRVGGEPAIIHIIRHFVRFGVKNIYIAGGYKFNLIVNEITDRFKLLDKTKDGQITLEVNEDDLFYKANITLIDTGYETGTSQRIKKVLKYLPKDNKETFVTYGDSFSNVDLDKVNEVLNNTQNVAVLTAVNFIERFGILKLSEHNQVSLFAEKSQSTDEFVNGGYIACSDLLSSFILDSDDDFSSDTLPRLQEMNKLGAYVHKGFWFAMDSQRDWEKINKIYESDPNNFLK